MSPVCSTILRPPVPRHTSSASNGQPPHAAASTAEAVAGPTPFSSAVRAVTAFFNGPCDTRAAATSPPPSDGGVDREEFPGRKRNASRLLAFTCKGWLVGWGLRPKMGLTKENALIGMSKAVEIFLVSFTTPSIMCHPFVSVFVNLYLGEDDCGACIRGEGGGSSRDRCCAQQRAPNVSLQRCDTFAEIFHLPIATV